jgi:hypothetical protein
MCPQRPSSSTTHTLYRRSEFDAYELRKNDDSVETMRELKVGENRAGPLLDGSNPRSNSGQVPAAFESLTRIAR